MTCEEEAWWWYFTYELLLPMAELLFFEAGPVPRYTVERSELVLFPILLLRTLGRVAATFEDLGVTSSEFYDY